MGSLRKSRLSPYKQDRFSEHCFGIDSANNGQPLRCEPQDSSLLFSPAARNYRLENWKLKAKLCSAEKLKLMKATVVADGKENVAVQCN